MVKNLPANIRDTGDVCLILGAGRYPGGGNGIPFSWKIPWIEKLNRLQSMGPQRVQHD